MNEKFFLISLTALYGIACYPRSNRYCWACVITYPVLGLLLGLLIANLIGAFDPILIQSFLLSYRQGQLIQKVFRKVISIIPFRGLRTIGPGQIHVRPARGGFKTSAIEEA